MTKDLTGKIFGRLTVIKFADRINKISRWWCFCVCGKKKIIRRPDLISGNTQSCGCLQRERISEKRKIHGMSETNMYTRWRSMKTRVLNKKSIGYKNYGGRGITICKRWLKFENFYADMGNTFEEGLTLERKNNNRGYNKKNCCWASPKVQAGNTRRNVIYRGETATDASLRLCRNPRLVSNRIKKLGWSIKKAFTTPILWNSSVKNKTVVFFQADHCGYDDVVDDVMDNKIV